MTVLIYVDTSKQVGDPDHLKVLCRGADSFLGGTLTALTVDLVFAVLEQPGQTKTCTIVTAFTRLERDHFISIVQFGQIGVSSCSNDLLSLSTMTLATSYGVSAQNLKIKSGHSKNQIRPLATDRFREQEARD